MKNKESLGKEWGVGHQSCFKWSGKALQLRLLHNVTCQDLGAEYFRSEHCRDLGSSRNKRKASVAGHQ